MQSVEKRRVAAVAVALTVVVAAAATGGFVEIDAQYAIIGPVAVDPPPDQRKDRVALFLSGDGARAIYDSMPSMPEDASDCEEGLKLKTSGGLICGNHDGNSYSCSVAILLRSGATRPMSSC
jgi:hypothetical protein